MASVLDKIITAKLDEIAVAKNQVPLANLEKALEDAPPVRDFYAAVSNPGKVRLIAEVKKASPSKGIIREDFHPVEIAKTYQAHGASAISCLTDEQFFQGHLDYLRAIRNEVSLPVLRKDFIIDAYQVIEARVAGADAVLLIAECLDDRIMKSLYQQILDLGMTPLVELYEPKNLSRVIDLGTKLIGINNRDLRTFNTDLQHTVRLRKEIPAECAVVGESGINTNEDVEMLSKAGISAMLVGESLMRETDIGLAVKKLLGRHRP